MFTSLPAGVTTTLPSSQPPNLPSSQSLLPSSRFVLVQFAASSRSAPAGADMTNDLKWPHVGPVYSSIARQMRPLWATTGTGAQWYFASPSSRPVLASFGSVHVRPPSVLRRMTVKPYSFDVPMRYSLPVCTNRLDHHCPLIVARFVHVSPLSVEPYTVVVSRVLPGPKKS